MQEELPPRRFGLALVVGRHLERVRSRRALMVSAARACALSVCAALAALPLAAVWGVTHAQVEDYLGPNRVVLSSNFTGEVRVDLGPLGNAFLSSPAEPIGLSIVVGGVGNASGTMQADDLLSDQTLAAYTSLYANPSDVAGGLLSRLIDSAVSQTLLAELVLLAAFGAWWLRHQLLAPRLSRRITTRRSIAAFAGVLVLLVGSLLVPTAPDGTRIRVAAAPSRFGPVQVDNVLLADLLDRGITGVTMLARRQQRAASAFVHQVSADLGRELRRVPVRPRPGESLIFGYSDLHCNQAMTEIWTRLVTATKPSLIISSGDDTVNGSAVELGCIRREARIGSGTVPMVVSTGNHDSDVTEAQMRTAGMAVLDGEVVRLAGIRVLGDDDPEHNVPFSVARTKDRPETEEQLGLRMLRTARTRPVDLLTLHQPAAVAPVLASADPPIRLVLYGHFHAADGPRRIVHGDGSWTVAMLQGTAGGVREPTITSFSTPFSLPLISADAYFYFRDEATGLITGVQPVHVLPDGSAVVDERLPTGDLSALSDSTRVKLGGTPSPSPSPAR